MKKNEPACCGISENYSRLTYPILSRIQYSLTLRVEIIMRSVLCWEKKKQNRKIAVNKSTTCGMQRDVFTRQMYKNALLADATIEVSKMRKCRSFAL